MEKIIKICFLLLMFALASCEENGPSLLKNPPSPTHNGNGSGGSSGETWSLHFSLSGGCDSGQFINYQVKCLSNGVVQSFDHNSGSETVSCPVGSNMHLTVPSQNGCYIGELKLNGVVAPEWNDWNYPSPTNYQINETHDGHTIEIDMQGLG